MRTTRTERMRAEQVSAAVDHLLRDPALELEPFEGSDAARRLARLPALLGPVDPALEQRVMARVRAGTGRTRPRPVRRLGWAAAGLAAVLLVGLLLTPLGQTAVASFLAVFNLGRTEVRITPVDTPADVVAVAATAAAQNAAVQQRLTLEDAQALVPFAIPQPAYLPPGYGLQAVNGYSYPGLPPWVPQPLFVELVYGDGAARACTLRLYPIVLGDGASIAGMNLEAAPIEEVQDVAVNGQPGVLLRLDAGRDGVGWQELVWEQGDLILALSASHLSEADLLRIARSVR